MVVGSSNQEYFPLSESSSLFQGAPLDCNISSEWTSFAQYQNSSLTSLDLAQPTTTIPNLQSHNILLQREKEDCVFRNLNKASNRLESQRAILPPREWFLPEFVSFIKEPTSRVDPENINFHLSKALDNLNFPPKVSPEFYSSLRDDISTASSSDHIDSCSNSMTQNTGYVSAIKRPISQPDLPKVRHNLYTQQRRLSELSHSVSSFHLEKSHPSLLSFVSLLETTNSRLDQQRASLRSFTPRPQSWGHPLKPESTPVFQDHVKERRGSLKSAFERVCKGKLLFKKKSVTGLSAPKTAPVLDSNALDSYNESTGSLSPLRSSFWGSKRKPT